MPQPRYVRSSQSLADFCAVDPVSRGPTESSSTCASDSTLELSSPMRRIRARVESVDEALACAATEEASSASGARRRKKFMDEKWRSGRRLCSVRGYTVH